MILGIWPGRALAVALLVPALLSLGLFVTGTIAPALVLLDVAIGLAALADLVSLAGSGRFHVQRSSSAVGSLGEPQQVELTVGNHGRRGRRVRIRDDVPETFHAEPAEFLIDVPARGCAVVNYSVVPGRRGTYVFEHTSALVLSRLGFWQRSVVWPERTEVRVYPDVRQIDRYTVLARRDRLNTLGVRRSRALGTDNEFERLRDYMEGDEPRHMDWRATARRRKLTVRAHQVNQSQRLVFLIDCGRMMAGDTGGGLSPLDHALNAMLLLAHVALIRGDQVGLLAFSDRIRAYVPPAGGARRIERLVHSVHNVFPELVEPRYDRAFVELEKRCRKRSLVVLVTNLFDAVNAQIVAEHLSILVGRHLPLLVLLRDHDLFALADAALDAGSSSSSGSSPALYPGAAAAALLNWRERTLVALRRRGVLTLDLFPDEMTAPMINQYLQIKARHLL
jgi:uncharacterized protein (DUF58 family)